MDWLGLLAVQGTLKSLLQHHTSKASILWCSALFTVQLLHPYMTTGKTIALTRWTFVGKIMSLLFNILSRLVIKEVIDSSKENPKTKTNICDLMISEMHLFNHCTYFPALERKKVNWLLWNHCIYFPALERKKVNWLLWNRIYISRDKKYLFYTSFIQVNFYLYTAVENNEKHK